MTEIYQTNQKFIQNMFHIKKSHTFYKVLQNLSEIFKNMSYIKEITLLLKNWKVHILKYPS